MAMNDGVAGQNGEVLRLAAEAHDQNITGSRVDGLDANEAGLAFHDAGQHTRRDARVTGHIDILGAHCSSYRDQQTGAVKRRAGNAALMHEWRADLGAGGSNDLGGGQLVPREE